MISSAEHIDFALGTSATYFSYHEEVSAPNKSTESAIVVPILADLKIYAGQEMSNLELKYLSAQNVSSRYVGTDLNTGAPVQTTDTLGFTNYEGDINLALSGHLQIYVGYGYRQWNRFLSGNPGYREIYSWYYTPVGLQILNDSSGKSQWGFDVSMRPTSGGTIKVITSQTVSGGQDSKMTLGGRTGYRLALPWKLNSGGYFWGFTPWYEQSAFGQSNVVPNSTLNPNPTGGIYEPNSKTNQYGLDFILGWRI
jgi:hypothetical protein